MNYYDIEVPDKIIVLDPNFKYYGLIIELITRQTSPPSRRIWIKCTKADGTEIMDMADIVHLSELKYVDAERVKDLKAFL